MEWTAVPEGFRLVVHEVLPSTSDLIAERARSGEPEGLAVLARRQTAGRGREGRAWMSPAGNLYLSVLLRPGGGVRGAPQWALLAAVALAETLEPLLPASSSLSLKWPNDVLLDGGKLAGILAEASASPAGDLDWISLGIGVNLAHAPELPDRKAMSLAAAGLLAPTPEVMATHLLGALNRWRKARATEGFSAIRAAWLRWGPVIGTLLSVRQPSGSLTGSFAGLGDDGSLLLEVGDRIHAVVAGEVAGREDEV